MDMWYFARICTHARRWREFAKCRFAHFPSFFSVHVDTYAIGRPTIVGLVPARYVRHSQMCPQLDVSDKNTKKQRYARQS